MELPDDQTLRWIVKTFAHLRAAHGEAIGSPVLLQPTGEFFPDEFLPDGPGLGRLLRRMLAYAPLSAELGIELAVSSAPEEHGAGGCGSVACGPAATRGERTGMGGVDGVAELENGYRVTVAATDLGNPDVLATSLARSTGALVLHEAGEPVAPASSEIAAVACGFGVLLANGAAVWAKSCGGLRMSQASVLSVEEMAVALALFVAVHRCGAGQARKHLGTTQREAFEAAWDWVESNPLLVESLRDEPARIEAGAIDLQPVRGVFGLWLHKRALERDKTMRVRPAPPSPAAPDTEERRRRLARVAEIDALLDLPDS